MNGDQTVIDANRFEALGENICELTGLWGEYTGGGNLNPNSNTNEFWTEQDKRLSLYAYN